MGVKSIATKGDKSEKKKEAGSEHRPGEEDVNLRADVSMGSVDIREERKDEKKKKKKKKKKKESVDRGDDVSVEGVEEQAEKHKRGKKGKEGSEDRVRDKEGEDEVGGDVDGLENDRGGEESVKEKKENKKRKGENASGDLEEKMEGANGEREESMKKKKKREKKRKGESGSDGMEDETRTDEDRPGEEGDREKKKKKKESKSNGMPDGVEVEAETGEEGLKSKKKRKTKSGSVSDGMGDKEVEKSRKKKKKARTKNGVEISNDASENPNPKRNPKRVSFSDNVQVFDELDNGSSKKFTRGETGEEVDGMVHGKRFTPEEDKILKDAVFEYIEMHNLGENGLDMVLHCQSHREVRNCWKEIAEALPHRPVLSVYCRVHVLFERSESRKWTNEEMEYVREFYKKHGPDWKKLSLELNKSRIHCKDTWRRIKLLNQNKGRWKQEEYQGLFDLVNKDLRMRALEDRVSKHGMLRDNICWEAISDKLGTRNLSSCCIKWYVQLSSPMVDQGCWTDTDDYRMLDALSALDAPSMEDVDWDSLLDHREGDISLKRWNQMVKHIGEYQKLSFSEQVEVLGNRYSPDCVEAREEFDRKPFIDA